MWTLSKDTVDNCREWQVRGKTQVGYDDLILDGWCEEWVSTEIRDGRPLPVSLLLSEVSTSVSFFTRGRTNEEQTSVKGTVSEEIGSEPLQTQVTLK